LREAAVELGEQRIYASHHSIMFARKSCYFFVRPKKNFLAPITDWLREAYEWEEKKVKSKKWKVKRKVKSKKD
jgi:hypothetical protein